MRLLGRGWILALASSLLVLGLVAAPAASAAPGDFDSSFGSGGTAVSQLNTGLTASTQVADVITDSAGRILVAGATTPTGSDHVLFVERYEANGTLDTSFGTDGVFELTPSALSGEDVANGTTRLALEPDGDIVVATSADTAGLVVEITPAGSLDTSFNAGGTPGYIQEQVASHASMPITADQTVPAGVAVAPATGDIWVDGLASFAAGNDAFLDCLTPSGTDCASDSEGTAYDFGSVSSPSYQAAGIVIEADGSILIGLGALDASGNGELGLAHFNADGSLDSTFGSDGVSLAYPGGTAQAYAVLEPVRLAQDGSRIVLLGDALTSSASPVLMGFTTQGAVDPTFGSEGTATVRVTTDAANTVMYGLAVQSDGKLDLAGYLQDPSSGPPAAELVRLTAAGALDPSFGTGGAVTQQFASGTLTPANGSLLYADAIDSAGQLVLGGLSAPPSLASSGILARVFLDQPSASLSVSPTNPVVGQTVTLTGSGSDAGGTIASYGWDFTGVGTYTSASGPTVSTTFATAGPHTVGLQVTDSDGQTATAEQTITVSPAPPVSPPVTPPASPQKTTAKVGNQQITLLTPALSACTASGKKLAAALASTVVPKSKGAKLKFSSAAFYLDKGVKHTHKKTTGKGTHKKTVTVTTYSPNATTKHAPAALSLSIKGLKAGTHTLTVKVSYKESEKKHGHKVTVTVTKTLKAKFKVC
jgi:uncharacterized delta-60 repeat protein